MCLLCSIWSDKVPVRVECNSVLEPRRSRVGYLILNVKDAQIIKDESKVSKLVSHQQYQEPAQTFSHTLQLFWTTPKYLKYYYAKKTFYRVNTVLWLKWNQIRYVFNVQQAKLGLHSPLYSLNDILYTTTIKWNVNRKSFKIIKEA